MFLGSFEFTGDPDTLVPAYDKLVAAYPDAVDLHACVVGDHGIVVLDACPSREAFDGFTASAEFLTAVADAGLPQPVVTALGEVHRARLRQAVG
jgi:hypothetical protein